jgi:hypothetical protein
MIVGIATVAVLSHRKGYRLGGVMVLPLVAIYTFREPFSPLIFVVGTAAAWVALWAVREYTLHHGRRVFLIAVLTGACATTLAAYVIAFHTPAHLPFDDAEVVASIFPGVAAYNLMRLDPEDRVVDACVMVAVFAGLMLLGIAGLFFFEGRPTPTPPILALPTSDLITWLGIESRSEPITQITPEWLSISLLVMDVLIYESIRKRYDLRLAGIILIPLLAVFSVRLEYIAALFAIGATVVFVLLAFVHWLSLLYGRVLLGIALIVSTLYALAIGVYVDGEIPGITLYFLGLFVGVAAYNLHRVSPTLRSASLRISAGLFAAFYAVLILFVDIPPSGLFYHNETTYFLLGSIAIGLAIMELYRLEQSRPSLTDFARASVFAKVDIDGADTATSPLVDGAHETESDVQSNHNSGGESELLFDTDSDAESTTSANTVETDQNSDASSSATGGLK